jgi:transglutaminase-like putative cysteine protease
MTSTTLKLDLEQFKAGKGLPELHQQKIKQQIDETIVAGIDKEHNRQMITFCDATAEYLYSQYTPAKPTYKRGSRPLLERVADAITSRYQGEANQIQAMVTWVVRNITHPISRPGKSPADTAPTEERIIEHGWGWCNEQGRTLVALAQVAGYPARMCFLLHKKAPRSHATTEIFFNNKWVWVDPTYGCFICADPDRPFSARELHEDPEAQRICDDQYARAQITRNVQWFPERIPDVATTRPGSEAASEFFHYFALCNYII